MLSVIDSTKLNGHDPWAHLREVFERLPARKHRDLAQLLPHNWHPATDVRVTSPIAAPTTAPETLAAWRRLQLASVVGARMWFAERLRISGKTSARKL